MHVLALSLLLTVTVQGLAVATPLRNQVKSLVNKQLSKSLAIIQEINQTDKYGRNALHYAAELGDLSLVKFLINNGVNTKAQDNTGLLPLDYAISEAEEVKSAQQMLIVSYILEKTYGINGRDDKGWPPLNWALLSGDPQYVEDLILRGSRLQSSALDVAILMNDEKIMASLTKNERILAVISERILAVIRGGIHSVEEFDRDYEKIDLLFNHGADPNSPTESGKTILYEIVSYIFRGVVYSDEFDRAYEMIELLLKNGADPNFLDENNHTPLGFLASLPTGYDVHLERRRIQIGKLLQSYTK